ncbi:hypothetical protein [Variovorax sp. PvP013]|uniref:hypothetical protein n=1 Tax=Variovorax sp. PvP013 TaxID=3156435 RepID=UPI003D1F730A
MFDPIYHPIKPAGFRNGRAWSSKSTDTVVAHPIRDDPAPAPEPVLARDAPAGEAIPNATTLAMRATAMGVAALVDVQPSRPTPCPRRTSEPQATYLASATFLRPYGGFAAMAGVAAPRR